MRLEFIFFSLVCNCRWFISPVYTLSFALYVQPVDLVMWRFLLFSPCMLRVFTAWFSDVAVPQDKQNLALTERDVPHSVQYTGDLYTPLIMKLSWIQTSRIGPDPFRTIRKDSTPRPSIPTRRCPRRTTRSCWCSHSPTSAGGWSGGSTSSAPLLSLGRMNCRVFDDRYANRRSSPNSFLPGIDSQCALEVLRLNIREIP